MDRTCSELLNRNNISINETPKLIEFRASRNYFHLITLIALSITFIILGLLATEIELRFACFSVALVFIVKILTRWKGGRIYFLINKENDHFLIPADNKYETTSEIRFADISKVSIKQSETSNVSYIFIEITNRNSELILKLRFASTDQLNSLKGWLEDKLMLK